MAKQPHKTDWYKELTPFADIWTKARIEMKDKMKDMTNEELEELIGYCSKATPTNCWFAIYRVARDEVPDVARLVMSIRKDEWDKAV